MDQRFQRLQPPLTGYALARRLIEIFGFSHANTASEFRPRAESGFFIVVRGGKAACSKSRPICEGGEQRFGAMASLLGDAPCRPHSWKGALRRRLHAWTGPGFRPPPACAFGDSRRAQECDLHEPVLCS